MQWVETNDFREQSLFKTDDIALLMTSHTILMPRTPECWESCGACAQGEVFILEIPVAVGDWLDYDQTILTLETGKVALDIPSPRSGRITALHVTLGDRLAEGTPLLTLASN